MNIDYTDRAIECLFTVTDFVDFEDAKTLSRTSKQLYLNEVLQKYIQQHAAFRVDSRADVNQLTLSDAAKLLPNRKYRIIFTDAFNDCIDDLPEIITKITFGKMFNQPVDSLPAKLTALTFGYDFNQPVDSLPAELRSLKFEWRFNKPVDSLPAGLTTLTFGERFNKPVERLPSGIINIAFGVKFQQFVQHLSPTVLRLKLHASYALDVPVTFVKEENCKQSSEDWHNFVRQT